MSLLLLLAQRQMPHCRSAASNILDGSLMEKASPFSTLQGKILLSCCPDYP